MSNNEDFESWYYKNGNECICCGTINDAHHSATCPVGGYLDLKKELAELRIVANNLIKSRAFTMTKNIELESENAGLMLKHNAFNLLLNECDEALRLTTHTVNGSYTHNALRKKIKAFKEGN